MPGLLSDPFSGFLLGQVCEIKGLLCLVCITYFPFSVNGEVPCKFCISKQRKIEYALAHQPTPVERNILNQEAEIFVTPEDSEER